MRLGFGNNESCFVIVVGIAEAVVPVLLQLCHTDDVGSGETISFGGVECRQFGCCALIAHFGRGYREEFDGDDLTRSISFQELRSGRLVLTAKIRAPLFFARDFHQFRHCARSFGGLLNGASQYMYAETSTFGQHLQLDSESSHMITYHATAGLAIDHPLWFLFAFAAARFAVFDRQIGSDIS